MYIDTDILYMVLYIYMFIFSRTTDHRPAVSSSRTPMDLIKQVFAQPGAQSVWLLDRVRGFNV